MDAKLGGDASEATHKSVNALPPLPPPPHERWNDQAACARLIIVCRCYFVVHAACAHFSSLLHFFPPSLENSSLRKSLPKCLFWVEGPELSAWQIGICTRHRLKARPPLQNFALANRDQGRGGNVPKCEPHPKFVQTQIWKGTSLGFLLIFVLILRLKIEVRKILLTKLKKSRRQEKRPIGSKTFFFSSFLSFFCVWDLLVLDRHHPWPQTPFRPCSACKNYAHTSTYKHC